MPAMMTVDRNIYIYIYIYVTTQERNGCYVTADSYRMANYCNGVQTKSKQVT